jgi:hypothetical protein
MSWNFKNIGANFENNQQLSASRVQPGSAGQDEPEISSSQVQSGSGGQYEPELSQSPQSGFVEAEDTTEE